MVELLIPGIAVLIVVIFILTAWYAWKNYQKRKAGHALADERTLLAEGKAAMITVFLTSYCLLALLWYVFITEALDWGLPHIETAWALIIAVLFNIGTYVGLRLYLGR
jgi:Na+/H+ antiporter NhaD/arsenite permease-like protein